MQSMGGGGTSILHIVPLVGKVKPPRLTEYEAEALTKPLITHRPVIWKWISHWYEEIIEGDTHTYSDTSANEDNSFRNHIHKPKLLAVSNVNNPVGLVCLPYVMWSAHFFVTHIQMENISSWNGPTVHVCCFMLAHASTTTFVSRVRKTAKKSSLAEKFVSRVTR